MPIRLLLADDHSVVRQGLRMFLGLDPELEVVGEAVDGAEAVQLAERLRPDVVLMDLLMPAMSGLEATAEIRRRAPSTRVLVLTSVLEEAAVTTVLRAGAIGYLLKDTEADELQGAIKAAAAGRAQLSPRVAARLLAETRAPEGPDTLTASESEVLRLTAEGLSDQEIATKLLVTEPVVRSYIRAILGRLQQAEHLQRGLEDDLAEARQIQLSLLPEFCPQIPGWEFAAAYESARTVGGDLYDFLELPGSPRRLGLLIADVSGKGAAAALFMAHSRAILRAAALSDPRPGQVTTLANAQLEKDNHTRNFVSAFYAVLEAQTGRLTYSNAGHNRPLWYRAKSGQAEALPGRGTVLGVLPDLGYEAREIEIAPGDLLVLYTDGLTDALNAGEEEFGEARLRAAVAEGQAGGAAEVVQAVLAAVKSFSAGVPQADDFTVVALRRLARA